MAIGTVQVATQDTGAGGTQHLSFSSTQKGNLVVFVVSGAGGTATINSVHDNVGNTYQVDATANGNASASEGVIISGIQNIGGATSGTVGFNSATPNVRIMMVELSGIQASNYTDGFGTAANNASQPGVPAFNTTFANDIIIAGGRLNQSSFTPGAGYTTLGTLSFGAFEYKILSGTASVNGTASQGGNNIMAWAAVAYKASPAGTNLIQSSGTAVLGIGSTSTVWGANTTTGNLITVGVTLTNAAALGTVSSITDSQSNTYTKALSGTLSSLSDVLNVELWYAKNISGGAGSVTVNHTVDNCAMFAREYTGYNTLDGTAANNGSSTAPNSGTVTTNFANELLVVATGDDKGASQTWTAAGAFGDMVGTATTITGQSMEDNIVTSSGAQTGTLTLGAAANWESLMATFYNQIASSGGPGYKTLLGEGKS